MTRRYRATTDFLTISATIGGNAGCGHGGGAPGMNAILRVYPESGQAVIVFVQPGQSLLTDSAAGSLTADVEFPSSNPTRFVRNLDR